MELKMQGKCDSSFMLKTVSETKVLAILKGIKPKRCRGYDGISADLLKKTAEIIVLPLTRIINTSIETAKEVYNKMGIKLKKNIN